MVFFIIFPIYSINQQTLQYLKDIIGENRLRGVCQRPNIHIV